VKSRLDRVLDHERADAERRRWFQECLDGDLLRLAVQPIVRTAAPHETVAVECLLRSRHPVLSGPMQILDAVESTERVFELGRVVNRLAARWAETLPADLLIFVNVHPAQLGDPAVLERFAPLLPHAARIVLEITERKSLTDVKNWEAATSGLEEAGFQFAVDDLGAGYNGLSLLADLRPTFIKVDMSIVRNVHREPRKQRLVDFLVNFANSTSAQLVAEGVETVEEADALIGCGVHLLQGHYFARPSLDWPATA
jgi:EAL domain-containing protein (putative c-di-GMP-specific phosphodiesterase class I)